MANCKRCLAEEVCRYNDGHNLWCKDEYECPHFRNKADFVKVVRCENCQYKDECLQKIDCECTYTEIVYCSNGIRTPQNDEVRE